VKLSLVHSDFSENLSGRYLKETWQGFLSLVV